MDSTPLLGLAAFEQSVGSTFRAHHYEGGPELPEEKPVDIVLLATRQLRRDAMQDVFTVAFRGPEATPLIQGTYLFEHNHLGTHPMFIVPFQRESGFVYYEAVFNRLLRPLHQG